MSAVGGEVGPMTTPDPLAELRAAIQRLDDMRRDVFCHPDLAERVRAAIDSYGLGGIYTVRPSSILPPDWVCFVKPFTKFVPDDEGRSSS